MIGADASGGVGVGDEDGYGDVAGGDLFRGK